MNIQGARGAFALYATTKSESKSQTVASLNATESGSASSVKFSERARALAALDGGTDADVAARLAEIEARPGPERSAEDYDFVRANDKKLAELMAKPFEARTAEDISYMQKANGLVNTFANLSPDEMKTYDELMASGETSAARGISMIALARMMDRIDLPNGGSFDPKATPITSDSVKNLFVHAFGNLDASRRGDLDSLSEYLRKRGT